MITNELVDYIRTNIKSGTEKEKLTQTLLSVGWGEGDIRMAFESLEPKPVTPSEFVPAKPIAPVTPATTFTPITPATPVTSFKPITPASPVAPVVAQPKVSQDDFLPKLSKEVKSPGFVPEKLVTPATFKMPSSPQSPVASGVPPQIKNNSFKDEGYKMEPKIIVGEEDIVSPKHSAEVSSINLVAPKRSLTRFALPVIILVVLVVGGYFGIKTFNPWLFNSLGLGNNVVQPVVPVVEQPKNTEIPVVTTPVDTPIEEVIPPPIEKTNLEAGSIKLLTPQNNQELTAGSKITVTYELSTPVKFGAINIIANSCVHTLDSKEKVGQHSFVCTLPNQIGPQNIGIVEVIYSPTVDSKIDNGQINLVAPTT